jgi:acetophenone carboxylase
METLGEGNQDITLDTIEILENQTIQGEVTTEFQGRSVRSYDRGDVITFAFSTGGAGYGDPIERDPAAVRADIEKGTVSIAVAESIYRVVIDPDTNQVDQVATDKLRSATCATRLKNGKKYSDFEAEWLKKRPPEEILRHYGSWPDAKLVTPLMRP